MWEVEGHYQPQVQGQTFALREPMVHNDHDSLFHYFDKHNRYSDWEASLRVKGLMNDPREANLGGARCSSGCSTRCRSRLRSPSCIPMCSAWASWTARRASTMRSRAPCTTGRSASRPRKSARRDRPAPRMATTRWWRERRMIPARRFHAGPTREADVADATDAAHVWPRVGDPPCTLQRLDQFAGARPARPLGADGAALVAGPGFPVPLVAAVRLWIPALAAAAVRRARRRKALIRPSATVTYPWKVDIGEHAWIGDDAVIYSLGPVHIGAHAVVSQRSYLCAADHDRTNPTSAARARGAHRGRRLGRHRRVRRPRRDRGPRSRGGRAQLRLSRSAARHDLPRHAVPPVRARGRERA